jgi:hypothetical protein
MSESSDQSAAAEMSSPEAEEREAARARLPVPVSSQVEREPGEGSKFLRSEQTLTLDAEISPPPHPSNAGPSFGAFRDFSAPPKKAWSEAVWIRGAALALAVGVGWVVGASSFNKAAQVNLLASQLRDTDAKLADLVKKTARVAPAADVTSVKTDFNAQKKNIDGLSKGLDAERSNLGTVKASVDAMRGDLDTIKTGLQSAQTDLAASKSTSAKMDRLAERVDRLERQLTSFATGSIAPTSAAPAAAGSAGGHPSADAAKDSHPATAAKEPRASLDRNRIPPNGYVLRDVRDGTAFVENESGVHQVVPGEMLAGIGRVQAIERHGGRWVVVTSDGVIDSYPY